VKRHAEEIGVTPVTFDEMVYVAEDQRYEQAKDVPAGKKTLSISGTQVRTDYLERGNVLPAWFTRPEVATILAESYPPRHQQGVCIWFTGLSGAGKSTTAEILAVLLMEYGRVATLLDGDIVRTHLSKGLGFSKEDRDTNIRRIGFVAAEITRHGGIAICAAVSPYRSTRHEVRAMIEAEHFVEVFVDTPIEECERRDVKGMYAKARRGEITGFTGIDDPYEVPEVAELILDTLVTTPEDNARRVLHYLIERGFVHSGR
jgi:sulfate adenylyltransferase